MLHVEVEEICLPILAVAAYKIPAQVQVVALRTLSLRLLADPQRCSRHYQSAWLYFLGQWNRKLTIFRHNFEKDRVVNCDVTISKYFFKFPELQTSLVFAQIVINYFRDGTCHCPIAFSTVRT